MNTNLDTCIISQTLGMTDSQAAILASIAMAIESKDEAAVMVMDLIMASLVSVGEVGQ